jgi:hypothetical protein
MPQEGFEPTVPVFERAKTVHVLDRAATVIGSLYMYLLQTLVYQFVVQNLIAGGLDIHRN